MVLRKQYTFQKSISYSLVAPITMSPAAQALMHKYKNIHNNRAGPFCKASLGKASPKVFDTEWSPMSYNVY